MEIPDHFHRSAFEYVQDCALGATVLNFFTNPADPDKLNVGTSASGVAQATSTRLTVAATTSGSTSRSSNPPRSGPAQETQHAKTTAVGFVGGCL